MRRTDDGVAEVLEAMKGDIASRLRAVCSSMPADEFAKLVDDVAKVNLKYRTRRTDDMFDAVVESERRQKPA